MVSVYSHQYWLRSPLAASIFSLSRSSYLYTIAQWFLWLSSLLFSVVPTSPLPCEHQDCGQHTAIGLIKVFTTRLFLPCSYLCRPTKSCWNSFSSSFLSALCLPCLTLCTTSYAPQVQLVFLARKCFFFKWVHPSTEFQSPCNCPHCCLSLRIVCKFCWQWCCNSRPLKKMLKNIIFNVSWFSFPSWSQTTDLLCLYPPLL